MTLYDPEIAEIVKKGIPVEIEGKQYTVWSHRSGYRDWETDRKSTSLNSSHSAKSRMPSSA